MSGYVVKLIGLCDVFVADAENEDDAMRRAWAEVTPGDFGLHEATAKPEADAERGKRHADLVLP